MGILAGELGGIDLFEPSDDVFSKMLVVADVDNGFTRVDDLVVISLPIACAASCANFAPAMPECILDDLFLLTRGRLSGE